MFARGKIHRALPATARHGANFFLEIHKRREMLGPRALQDISVAFWGKEHFLNLLEICSSKSMFPLSLLLDGT